jgi:hypothetical protein
LIVTGKKKMKEAGQLKEAKNLEEEDRWICCEQKKGWAEHLKQHEVGNYGPEMKGHPLEWAAVKSAGMEIVAEEVGESDEEQNRDWVVGGEGCSRGKTVELNEGRSKS